MLGKNIDELNQGILIPIQKPGKKQGPCENLRPIILLSVLRKILTICLIERIGERVMRHIPPSQAAYQPGRSTTEQVFSYKLLAEKAIISEQYTSNIILMDMNKAFDKVNRETLLNDMKNIVEKDELHLIKLLLKNVELRVKCGTTTGQPFKTSQGVPQGDCISAVLFILYLAKSQKFYPHLNDHTYSKPYHLQKPNPQHIQEHSYSITKEKIYKISKESLMLNTEYADDIGKNIISQNNEGIHIANYQKLLIPYELKERQLECNPEKTEQFTIKRKGNESWKHMKYLGSKLDTNEDISRRKQLAMTAMIKLKHLWENNTVTLAVKLKVFNTCVKSVFMYNSEIWTLTESKENKIDAFQRKLLRKLMNIRYPNIISNEKLLEKTKQKNWSKFIAEQRLRWFGHVMRLPENSPAKQSFHEFERAIKLPRGRPQTTWIGSVKKQLKVINVEWENAKSITR